MKNLNLDSFKMNVNAIKKIGFLIAVCFFFFVKNSTVSAQCNTNCWSGWANNGGPGAGVYTPNCNVQTYSPPSRGYTYVNLTPGRRYAFTAEPGSGWTTPWVEYYEYNGSAWVCIAANNNAVSITAGNPLNNNHYLVVVRNGNACSPAWPGTSATLRYREVSDASLSASVTSPSCGNSCNGTVNLSITSPAACGTGTIDNGHYEQFSTFWPNTYNYSLLNTYPYNQNWVTSVNGNALVATNGHGYFHGNDSWTSAFYNNQNITRQAGRVYQGRWYNTGNWSMLGWKNTGTGTSYTDFTYAFYPGADGRLYIYEDGASRGDFTNHAAGIIGLNKWIDFKIVLKGAGADYYIRNGFTSEPWRLIYSSGHSSTASLRAGACFYSSCCWFLLDDLFVGGATRFPLTCSGDKTFAASDQFGNVATANATIGLEATAPTITTPPVLNTYTSPALGCKGAGYFDNPDGNDNCSYWSTTQNRLPASGLLGWYRADAGVVTDDNGFVQQWRDLSGNNNHISQVITASRPIEVSNAINGNPAIRFTTVDFMTSANVFTNPQYTILTVSKMNGGANSRLISSANTNWLMGYHGGGMNKLYANNWISNPATTADTAPHMYAVTSNGNNTTTTLYDYGVQIGTGNAGNPSAPGALQLNGWNNGFNEMSNGDISEVIVYNRVLTTDERQQVEGYLAHKYKISAPWASYQAAQSYNSGNTSIAFQNADDAGNRVTTTQNVTTTAYPGPVLTPDNGTSCSGGNINFNITGMAPAGNFLNCSASGAYLNPNPNPIVGANWTIEAWYNASALPANAGGWNTLIRGTNYHHIIIDRNSALAGQIGVYVGGFYSSGFNIVNNITSGWHHIAAVGSGGTTKFYIDGVYVGTAQAQATDNIVAIGNFQGGGQHFGQVDDVRIWNTALPQNAISNWMTREIASSHPNFSNFIHYYKMDGNGNDSRSSSTGTLQGGATASTATNYYTYNITNGIGGTLSSGASTTQQSFSINGATASGNVSITASANSCTSASTVLPITIRVTPTASVSGGTTVCQNATAPTITFTATPNTNVTYTRTGLAGNQTVNIGAGGSATITAPTSGGDITYSLVSVAYQSAPTCQATVSGSTTVTVRPTPTASIAGGAAVCQNTAAPTITFTATPNTTVTYTRTGLVGNQTINVGAGGTATITNTPTSGGNIVYSLVSVAYQAAPTCVTNVTGTTTVTVRPLPSSTPIITNVSCFGGSNGAINLNVTGGTPGYTYNWNPSSVSGSNPTGLFFGSFNVTITDANGCSSSASASITQPAQDMVLSTSSTNSTCGNANGGATVTLTNPSQSGGNAVSYTWSATGSVVNGTNTSTNSSIAAGSYTVTVTNAAGCTKVATINVTDNAAPTANITAQTNLSCFGNSNGSASVTITGGTAPYNLLWSNGNSQTAVPAGTYSTSTGLSAGTVSVQVTDANGCNASASTNITQPGQLTVSANNIVNASCFGGNDGSIQLNVLGGTGTKSFNWSGPVSANGQNPTGLVSGNYNVTVTDANSCQAILNNITVGQAALLSVSASNIDNVSCFGGNNGGIQLNVTGGTGSKTFNWSGPVSASGQNPTGLIAGNYNVTVTDVNSCQAILNNIAVGQAPLLTVSVSNIDDASCFGGNDGGIQLNVSGGTGTKTFSWSPSLANVQNPTGLVASNYSVTVTDVNSCTATTNATVYQPTDIILTIQSQDNVDCNGNSTGSVTLSASGGSGSFTYSEDDISYQLSPVFIGLAQGSHTFYAKDINNCVQSVTANITEPTVLVATVNSVVNADCFGAATGELSGNGSGGTPPYTYSWDGPTPSIGQNVASLLSGNYDLVVTDGKNCTATANTFVGQATQLNATVSKVDVTVCSGSANGEINFTNSTGGTGNYRYSIDGAASFQASPNFTGLIAGTYDVFIKDNGVSNCEVSLGSLVVSDAPGIPAPTFPGGNSYSSCGLIVVNAIPGAGADQVALFYDDPFIGLTHSIGTSFVLRNLPAGTYTFYGRSYNSSINCFGSAFTSFTLEVISPLLLSGTAEEVSCFGLQDGEIDLIATGATLPYTYAWSNGANTEDLTNLNGGVYTVTVTDPNGCFNIETFNVTEYSPLNAEVDIFSINGFNSSTCTTPSSFVQTNATGGKTNILSNDYIYLWSDGGNTALRDDLLPGNYTVTVTDDNGCSLTRTIQMTAPPALAINILESFECSGGGGYSSAALTVLPSGGFAPYEFSLDNVNYQTSNKFTGLSDGSSVTVYVKDQVDCVESTTLTINFPPANVPVGDCDFIYVAPESQGGNAANIGTPDCPTTLPAAISYVNANRNYIRVLQGTYIYNEPVVLASNVVIEGGYTKVGNDWVKQTATSTLSFNEAYQSPATGIGYYAGFISSGASNWTLKDLNIDVQLSGAVGQQDGRGKSVYGILVNNNSSNYRFTNVNVATGNASNGANGAAGVNGVNGLNGAVGQNGEFIVGSPGTCCNGTTGQGGNGANGVGAAGGTGETAANYLNNGGSNKNQPRGSNGIRSSGAGGAGGHGGSTLNTTPNGGRTSGVGGNGGYDGSSYNAIGANQANGSGTLVWDFYNQPTPSPVAAGTSGSNGGNGSNASLSFAPNNTPTAYQLLNYFVPGNGQNGGDGFGGAGGAGGGGAGSAIVDGTNGSPSFTHVLRGSGGGAGGSGGQGGQGGQGGNGGGASFGIYVATNSVTGATFQAVNVSAIGTAGTGGSGGNGGTGGVGGQGGQGGPIVQDQVNNVTLLSQAGNGGNGGIGGNGGRGQDGDNGITQAIYFGGNTPPAQSSPAANGVVTVNGLKGCTNSVISITKTSGDNWSLLSGGNFVNDITNSSSSFTNSSSPADVYYNTTGWKNINVGATTLNDYIFIRQVRNLPVITSAPFGNICVGSTINLTTSAIGQQYLWEIALASAPQTPVLTFTSKDVNNVTISTAGTYQVKLQVEETCCGWSVPVYATLVVNPLPTTIASISGTTSVCVGETAVYSVNFAANAAPNVNSTTGYKWVIPAGANVISSGGLDGVNSGGTNSITITYGSSGGTLFVTPSNNCGNGATTSTAITIKSSPTGIVFSGNTTICVGASTAITAVAQGGSGGYSYLWSNSANTNIVNVSPTMNTNYAVTATASNGCSIASNVNVIVLSPQAPTLNAETNVTGGGFTANWNAATSATAYFLDVATDNSFTNFVAGYNNLNVGNVLTYNVSGLSPNQTYYYRLRTAIASCTSPNSVTGIVNTAGLVWNGNIDTDWFDENNWTPAIVPTAISDATIPAGRPNYPVITNFLQPAEVRSLNVNANASVTIDASYDLEIYGNLTNNGTASFGTGRLLFKGTGTQNLFGTVSVRIFNIQNATTIATTAQVNVTGVLQLQSGQLATNGKLTLKSDINRTGYVDDFSSGFSGTVTGNLAIERYIPETNVGGAAFDYLNRYHYIGALTGGTVSKWTATNQFKLGLQGANGNTIPINDGVTTITPTSDCSRTTLAWGTAFSNLFTYNEAKVTDCYLQGWEPRTAVAPTPRGRGFAARINDANIINASRTLSETGSYSNSSLTLNNLSVTAANTTNTTPFNNKGLHIVSNPFWAPIDWALVASSNPSSNLDATMYLYNPTTGIFEHVNNLSAPALRIISTNAAFMVMPLDNTQSSFDLTIPASARVNSDNNELLRQRQGYAYGMHITAASADNKQDYTRIVFDNDFTEGYDNGYDARKMFSSVGVPSIYTRDIDNYRNGILALPENTQTTTIPLGVAIEYNGSHTLTFDGITDFPNTSIVWLEDLQTGTIQYLRDNNIYSFTGNKTDDADRFLLHFAPELLITATQANCDNENGTISINERGGLEWTYTVTDANNATINSNSINGSQETISQLPSGTYAINLTNTISGYQTTETVTVSQVATVAAVISTQNATVNVGDIVIIDATNTTGATNISVDMGDGTTYNNEVIVNHSYQVGGNYTVTIVANNDNCSAQSTLQVMVMDLTTSIADNTKAEGIKVYANQNELYIEQHLAKGEVSTKVELYNMLGQIVSTYEIQASYQQPYTVTIQDVARGTYIVRVIAKGKVVSKRVLVGE